MVEKRSFGRKPARLKVRFWRAGSPDRVFTGYTTNISRSGCFIQTEHPIGTAGRLQLELSSDDLGFVCEGVVARSIKAPYELRQVKPSGMGVRFLTIEELVRAVVPGNLDAHDSANKALKEREPSDDQGPDSHPAPKPETPVVSPRITDFEAASPTAMRAASRHPAARPLPPTEQQQAQSEPKTAAAKSDQPKPDHAFRIAPPTIERLAALYHAELQKDRLFIPSSKASRVGATVRVELVLPTTGGTAASKSVELHGVVRKQWSKGDRTPNIEGLGIKLLNATSAKKTIGTLIANA